MDLIRGSGVAHVTHDLDFIRIKGGNY